MSNEPQTVQQEEEQADNNSAPTEPDTETLIHNQGREISPDEPQKPSGASTQDDKEGRSFAERQSEVEEELDEGKFRTMGAEGFADLLVRAEELSARNLDANLNEFRSAREVGDEKRVNSFLDETIIALAQRNHPNLVKSLLSSSSKETIKLNGEIDTIISDQTEATRIKEMIKQLHAEKQAGFKTSLSEKGVDAIDQQTILNNFDDPDSVLEIDQTLLRVFTEFSQKARGIILGERTQLTNNLIQAAFELQKNGIELTEESKDLHESIWVKLAGNKRIQNPGINKEIDRDCSNWKIKKQYLDKFVPENGSPSKYLLHPERIWLDDLPLLQSRFEELSIDQPLAGAIFASWSTYNDAFTSIMSSESPGAQLSSASEDQINRAKHLQADAILAQLNALSGYAEKYGNVEVLSIINTFGIFNFERHNPEALHAQLENWNSGKIPARNILVSARADFNRALKNSGEEAVKQFGPDGFFCFEANNPERVAKIAVKIGQREKSNGRDPQIQNFIINGHGSPHSILLGVNDNVIHIQSYNDADKNRAKIKGTINDYKRHLGNNYRLILNSCSTSGEGFFGPVNIASKMSEGHNVQVESATEDITGLIVNPDDSITFISGKRSSNFFDKIPGITYKPSK